MYGLVITIVRDPGTAEDVAQETFVRAWRHAGTYDARRARVATWLLTIARNAAIDALRVRRVEPLDPELVAAQARSDRVAPSDELRGGRARAGPRRPLRAARLSTASAVPGFVSGATAREISAF